jgi:hypothetical protein
MTIATPTHASSMRDAIEQRERQMQIAFPAKVISYTPATCTARLEPQFIETWREGSERVSETFDATVTATGRPRKPRLDSDAYIDNIPVCFPRAGDYRMTFPIAAGDFGLVICTKFSLDVWRETATAGDPGDLRRFTMSGATFHPVSLSPNDSTLDPTTDADHATVISLSAGGTTDFVALAAKVKTDLDAIKAYLDEIKADYNLHTHGGVTAGAAFTGAPGASTPATSITSTYTVTDPKSSKVKVE